MQANGRQLAVGAEAQLLAIQPSTAGAAHGPEVNVHL